MHLAFNHRANIFKLRCAILTFLCGFSLDMYAYEIFIFFFFILHMYFCLHDGSVRISQVRRSTAWLPVLVYSWCCIYWDPWCRERHIYSVVVFHLLPRLPEPLVSTWCGYIEIFGAFKNFLVLICVRYHSPDFFVRGMWLFWESSWGNAQERVENCECVLPTFLKWPHIWAFKSRTCDYSDVGLVSCFARLTNWLIKSKRFLF